MEKQGAVLDSIPTTPKDQKKALRRLFCLLSHFRREENPHFEKYILAHEKTRAERVVILGKGSQKK
jgi:hypothetical protein